MVVSDSSGEQPIDPSVATTWLLVVYAFVITGAILTLAHIFPLNRKLLLSCLVVKPPTTWAALMTGTTTVSVVEMDCINRLHQATEADGQVRRRVNAFGLLFLAIAFVGAISPFGVTLFFPNDLFMAWQASQSLWLRGQLFYAVLPTCAYPIALSLQPVPRDVWRVRAAGFLFGGLLFGTVPLTIVSMYVRPLLCIPGIVHWPFEAHSDMLRTYDDAVLTTQRNATSECILSAACQYSCPWGAYIFFNAFHGVVNALVATLMVATVAFSECHPRKRLLRLWFLYRMITLAISAFHLQRVVADWATHGTIPWGHVCAAITFGFFSCIVAHPRVRGRAKRRLNSIMTPRSGGKHEEAAFVSALMCQRALSGADAYIAAQRLFRGLPLRAMPEDIMHLKQGDSPAQDGPIADGSITDRPGQLYGRRPDFHHHGERSISSLRELTVPARLGEVAAFVSYSWRDDADSQYAQILQWKDTEECQPRTFEQPDPMIWIDRACIDTSDIVLSLGCLPVFLAGCKKLIVLAGPTYTSRLWVAMELFVFVRMGGTSKDVEMLLAERDGAQATAENRAVKTALVSWRVDKAKCYAEQDRQALLGAVEATFGTHAPLNKILNELFTQKLSGLDAAVESSPGAVQLSA